ncbi:DtxR family transcriptional regulator [Aminipila butyrica]|uniref:Manganese transport regulator n=1 Tax=Aminipila butyrica TaxID=433296 RepID=A0A858BVQ4_9FIRM|nr:iron dependent repressor, metal binding and dimerization domain protein [Aminipila butyrica]QIB68990.1 DtxR family transcriptional regulator [Aminipila butyrica]
MSENTNSDFKTVRGYQTANRQNGQLTSALEDYLEMTYRLCQKNEYTRIGILSEHLNVRPSSVSKMIYKLAALGYLKYNRYEIIQLTDAGQEVGEYLLKRHETIERFLNLLGSSNPLEETELMEHSLDVSTVSNINTLLEFFQENEGVQNSYNLFKAQKK